jgi:PPM family protein phosphatase
MNSRAATSALVCPTLIISRISRKALRLYDEPGLLRPVEVDPVSQYRLYDPARAGALVLQVSVGTVASPCFRVR